MSFDSHKLCSICAWREDCRKKFSLPHDALHCPDFTRDITIKDSTEKEPVREETGEK